MNKPITEISNMTRDNFQHLFRRGATTSAPQPKASSALPAPPSNTNADSSVARREIEKDGNGNTADYKTIGNDTADPLRSHDDDGETTIDFTSNTTGKSNSNADIDNNADLLTDGALNGNATSSKNVDDLLETTQNSQDDNNNTLQHATMAPTVAATMIETHSTQTASGTPHRTRPGTESMQFLSSRIKTIGSLGSNLLSQPWREFQLAEKLNAINVENEELEAERLRRELEQRDRRNSGQNHKESSVDIFFGRVDPATAKNEATKQLHHTLKIENQGENDEFKTSQSEQLARTLQDEEETLELERLKHEADERCARVGHIYDALAKFIENNPHGTYEDFVEFLLLGAGANHAATTNDNSDGGEADYNPLLFENFYDENSEYRKLWNDNLTMGLPGDASTVEGRAFVPAISSSAQGEGTTDVDKVQHNELDPWDALYFQSDQQDGTSQNEATDASSHQALSTTLDPTHQQHHFTFDQLRERTASEGERIKKLTAQVDKQKLKEQIGTQLGSAVHALSNVSSFALKPLRDLQLAERLNAMNLDMEDDEARKENEQHERMEAEKREYEEAMMLKKEAEEHCLNATREHLLEFIKTRPDARYHEWIEDFHPENAHDGALLEGLGKTIDHRFYVEESDHRKLWNEHLHTFVEDGSEGRMHVPARAKQWDDSGNIIVAADLLSDSIGGLGYVQEEGVDINNDTGKNDEGTDKSLSTNETDLIAFD